MYVRYRKHGNVSPVRYLRYSNWLARFAADQAVVGYFCSTVNKTKDTLTSSSRTTQPNIGIRKNPGNMKAKARYGHHPSIKIRC